LHEGYIVKITDDTFEAVIDLKYGTMQHITFRVLGVNTAEKLDEIIFEKAKDFQMEYILNKNIHIFTPKNKHGGFGTYLCEVLLSESEDNLWTKKLLLVEELNKDHKRRR
jgi:hypothetical protein